MTAHTFASQTTAPAPSVGGRAGAGNLLTRSQRRAARTLACIAVFVALWCTAMLAIPFVADSLLGAR